MANISAWSLISLEPRYPDGVLTDGFIQRFDQYMDWELLSMHYFFTVELLRIYFHRVNWAFVIKRQKLPEDLLVEMSHQFENCCWHLVSKFQDLSEDFIDQYKEKLDWEYIFQFQNVSLQFLRDHKEYLTPINTDYNITTTSTSGSGSDQFTTLLFLQCSIILSMFL